MIYHPQQWNWWGFSEIIVYIECLFLWQNVLQALDEQDPESVNSAFICVTMRKNEAECWVPDDSATQDLNRPVHELQPCWQAFVISTAQVTALSALKQQETSSNIKAVGIQCQAS